MGLHGRLGDEQALRDLGIGQPLGGQEEDILFTCGQGGGGLQIRAGTMCCLAACWKRT